MFKIGDVVRNNKVVSVLRPGAGGNVCVVEDVRSNEKSVLKSSYLDDSKKAEFERIIASLKSLSDDCENVVKIKSFFYEGNYSCVLMEYCEGGDLETEAKNRRLQNKRFSEQEISKITCHVFKGLNAVHAQNMIHRDIKLANILISKEGIFKLADFNVARILSDDGQMSMTFAGTLQYVAPEILLNKTPSFSADVYAMGAVLYELLTLRPAFVGNVADILANRYAPIDSALGYSADIVTLVGRLLALEPAHRPSVREVLFDPLVTRAHMDGTEHGLRMMSTALATLQRTVAEQRETIEGQGRALAEQQRVTAEQQRAAAERSERQERALAELRETVQRQERVLAEQQRVSAELRTNVSAQQKTIEEMQRHAALSAVSNEASDLLIKLKDAYNTHEHHYFARINPGGPNWLLTGYVKSHTTTTTPSSGPNNKV